MTSHLLLAAASVAMLGTGLASAQGTRSSESLPAQQTSLPVNQANVVHKCRVDVIRTGTAGVADVTRTAAQDGTCICTVTTGVVNVNGSAEQVVTDLLRDRTCDGAPPPAGTPAAFAPVGTALWPFIVGPAGAGGLAAAVGNDSQG